MRTLLMATAVFAVGILLGVGLATRRGADPPAGSVALPNGAQGAGVPSSAPAGAATSEPPAGASGTARMVHRLAQLATSPNPEADFYANRERVAYFLAQPVPQDPRQRAIYQIRLAREQLLAGDTEAALERFAALRTYLVAHPAVVDDKVRAAVQQGEAIGFMRLGEQQNCLIRHGIESCLMPIRPGGVHVDQRGSREAFRKYMEILQDNPRDLTARWLLNIAAMTLGEHPGGVPRPYLMPPELFASDHDIGRFHDVAPATGTDVVGLSGGSIMEDFDGDGLLDIMASSWGRRDQLRYFRSRGDGTFEDATERAGLTGLLGGLNLIHADYDNDGHPDVLVLRGAWLAHSGHHPNSLLRNRGDGTFEDVTEEAGVLDFHPTQTAAWADYDGDGWLDLFVGNESAGDDINPCKLFRSRGDGTFEDVAPALGLNVTGIVKSVVWGDIDNDGRPDLYLSRLMLPNLLFRNDGPGPDGAWRFTEVGARAGVQEPIYSFPAWFWDFDNDGWLDLFVSGYGLASREGSPTDVAGDYLGLRTQAERARLYRNNGDGTFTDVAPSMGVSKVLYTMGSNYGDLDNDGWLDFYVGTGEPDLRALMPNRMFRNDAGRRFQDVTTSGGFGHLQKGHGVAFGDLDNDGDQDIYAVMGGAYAGDVFQNVLFENPGHGNHWLTLVLQGTTSNRAGIGARLKVTVQENGAARDIHLLVGTGGSFGSSSLQQEVGLGRADRILGVEIRWPGASGVQTVGGLERNRAYRIRQDRAEAEPLPRPAFSLPDPGGAGGHEHHQAALPAAGRAASGGS